MVLNFCGQSATHKFRADARGFALISITFRAHFSDLALPSLEFLFVLVTNVLTRILCILGLVRRETTIFNHCPSGLVRVFFGRWLEDSKIFKRKHSL